MDIFSKAYFRQQETVGNCTIEKYYLQITTRRVSKWWNAHFLDKCPNRFWRH